ncbi:phage tail protein [Tateyamaria sp. syn59]|uniref:phage tail protein n=1 Tax=Tateyamaria sp. syn59 TaxID=2576942 RepID=UPI001CB94EE6|nr:tail fiber protein [Tateyamaria sp. syn59]
MARFHNICGAVALMLGMSGALPGTTQKAAAQDYFIGSIITFAGNFCPRNFTATNGQLLPIAQFSALFSLLGTTYGGDGRTTFGLPNLQDRVAMGQGRGPGLTNRSMGSVQGQPSVFLTVNNLAAHSHAVNATNLDGDKAGPGDKLLAAARRGGVGDETIYSEQAPNVQMSAQMLTPTGGAQPMPTRDPYLVMTRCIALEGIYPSRN